ncbi:hypothetical protein EJ110_NYTH05844 [Nymphaea thermarum]|nr:hypothetical protein EJ110_NYTH05844 [Nymphaea thermarum]
MLAWMTGGLRSLRADTIAKLKKALPELEKEVSKPGNFKDFYAYAFRYSLYIYYQKKYKVIKMDQWMSIQRFCDEVIFQSLFELACCCSKVVFLVH